MKETLDNLIERLIDYPPEDFEAIRSTALQNALRDAPHLWNDLRDIFDAARYFRKNRHKQPVRE